MNNHNKNILYVWKSPYPWDVRVEKICKSLSKHYNVHLLAKWGGEQNQEEKNEYFSIFRAGFNQSSSKFIPIPQNSNWTKIIESESKRINADLIICREIMLAKQCSKVGNNLNIPVIMDMAENYPAAMKEWTKYNDNFIKRFIVHSIDYPAKLESKTVSESDGIIVVCDEQIDRLNSSYNFPKNKCTVVHNSPELIPDSNSYSVNTNKIIFGHHGHLTNEKSLKNFLIAFLEAAYERKEIELHLYGDGESKIEYEKIISSHPNKEKVKLFGKYNFNELPRILKSFSIGIIPYQMNDFNEFTIHNKIFDYFAYGLPVLVSENAPLKRIVNETKSGYIFDCENIQALKESITNIDINDFKNFSNNSFTCSKEKYNWLEDEKELLNFVKRIIDKD